MSYPQKYSVWRKASHIRGQVNKPTGSNVKTQHDQQIRSAVSVMMISSRFEFESSNSNADSNVRMSASFSRLFCDISINLVILGLVLINISISKGNENSLQLV